ncbi:MAG: hypothetical protein APG12_01696 [Candidatus Methanofastidiosum methylothiophilum]|uniref:N-acetyltransferase domain-containing protein n=1 Tax=Candidatus Methanofastidiosum methylothiophilum TaxID=1705564 RepID=A0A150IVP9_9EURY|nr:MAG: hypothetical protein APG10_01048 [Candidatus Methanofastidiosum methylthiophilus]KYC46933.1 MAG: hypothetical protein APG11_01568 [Candidatus Methanofastidiosum methylthiophilus]KYC49053.1 MAG: hypothetical protein APG12_01696 [Candidatus Methanofastidiosum methylthiophilus]
MSEIYITKYKKEHKPDLIKFLAYFYKTLNYETRKKLFVWRYESNPYINSPFIYLAFDGKKIIGFRAFVIQKFILKDKKFLLGTPADAVVHPQYRRKGLFSKLTEYAIDDMDKNSNIRFLVSLSANSASEAGNIKLGFVPIGKRKYVYKISLSNTLKSIYRNNRFQKRDISIGKNIKIEISKELRSDDISKLMNNFLNKNKIRNLKDDKFYNWVFGSSSNDYIYVYYIKNDVLLGYICLEKKSRLLYSLVEYGYTQQHIIKQLIEVISKEISIPFLRLYIFTKDNKEKSLFFDCGFRGENDILMKFLKKMNLLIIEDGAGMLIKPVSRDVNNNKFCIDGIDTRSPSNWCLFSSDIH